jgi:hypothetical protein
MPTVTVTDTSPASPEQILEAAHDFSPRRAEMWPDVHLEHLQVHESGDGWAEVTEGNPWPIGYVWERLRYEWSEPGSVLGIVIASNIFHAGSSWEIRATEEAGGSIVNLIAVRHLKGKGWLLAPFFPLGSARKTVAQHLRHFLEYVEESNPDEGL